jgi:glucan phosphoethanolaminetransferase (alkaline phosphatase superfamily)
VKIHNLFLSNLQRLLKVIPFKSNVNSLVIPIKPLAPWILTSSFSYCYILSEWIFLVTKPSFDPRIGFQEEVLFLLFALAVSSLLTSVPFIIIIFSTKSINNIKVVDKIIEFSCIIPALILTVLFFMLIENFTYTLFKIGILTFPPAFRILYLVFLIIIGYFTYNLVRITAKKLSSKLALNMKNWKYLYIIVGMILLVIIWSGFQVTVRQMPATRINPVTLLHKPNIILITGDGLNADHMSVYGYKRKTTPQIEKIAKESLIAMNSFTNSSDTQGSIISIFTGKTPIETGVLYPPDSLMESDAYDHLPGILHDAGYATYQLGYPFYADANSANLMEGFDYVNNIQSYQTFWSFLDRYFPSYHQLFFRQLVDRLSVRLKHLLWLEKVQNNGEFLSGRSTVMDDREKIEITKEIISSSSAPVFLHLHLLGTHGPHYKIQNRMFSESHVELSNWDEDYYDDAILEFDSMVGDIYQYVEKIGISSDTLIIIGSDHGQQWVSNKRIPLIIHFPDGYHKGKITKNTQNIDIFPTLLEYLEGKEQNGREGKSLLGKDNENRHIYSLGVDTINVTDDGRILLSTRNNEPPFYQFGFIGLVECDEWFKISLDQLTFDSGKIMSPYLPCIPFQEIDNNKAIQLMKEYLNKNGFNTSSLGNLTSLKETIQK